MRTEEQQFEIRPDAPLFGDGSPLDSLGLVTLIFDVEEALAERGIEINLSDARAMSQTRSPYRSVASMTDWILYLCDERA
jgi:acyl carrier protein